MSLGNALQVAQNSLASVSRRTDVVSRNVAGANDPNYVRREATVVSGGMGRTATHVSRAALDRGLVRSGLDARSDAGARGTIAAGVRNLSLDLNGPDGSRSPAAALGRLEDALQTWSADPSDALLADIALGAAKGVEHAFRDANGAVTRAADDAERRIGENVAWLNERLDAFGQANTEIVHATQRGLSPPHDALDRRDAALRDIAEIVPVSTLPRPGNDLMVTTRRGATLFETSARSVSFDAASGLAVDGVPLRASGDSQEPQGRLGALLHLRDSVVGETRAQLDATANATAEAFAASGLFTGTDAATIAVPAGYDMATLRAGPPSRADDIIAAVEAMRDERTFPAAAGLATERSLVAYAGDAIAALDRRSADATAAAGRSERIAAIFEEKRTQASGVDVDKEMTRLLALERSYEATARIIAVADRMLAELMAAVR